MTDTVSIRELALYKHGVGRVTRRGKATDRELVLSFGPDEIDDALKSLTVRTDGRSRVMDVRYRTPLTDGDGRVVLRADLADENALFGLLRGLRGIAVSVRLEGTKSVAGRVVGLEQHPQGRKFGAMLVLLTDAGLVEQIATDRIVQVRIDDERASRDLARTLDVAGSGAEMRAVSIDLTEPGTDMEISYTIPSPVWRVSYRLVANAADQTCLLQGWAIFDNRFDEDLEDVELSFIAGQPVSFRYDLTSSVIPQRRLVRDEGRIAAGPVEFEAMHDTPAFASAAPTPPEARPPHVLMRAPFASAGRRVSPPGDLIESTLVEASGEDLVEIFEYHVGHVSVPAGESAMVPVVQHTAKYSRELLYNGQKHPGHPVVSLRLRNDSGLTLERGPATIVEDGRYRGEAILPFTKEGAELVLAYAVEIGIRVLEETRNAVVLAGVELRDAFVHVQEYRVEETAYTLTNDTSEEQIVTVERARGGELTETREPDAESAQHRRWRVTCPPRASSAFAVTERWMMQRSERVADQSMETLSHYLAQHALDAEARRRLAGILRLRQTIAGIDQRLAALRDEQRDLTGRQDRLRANLSIEARSEDEQAIRRRSTEDFRRTQDREDEILAEIERLQVDRQSAEAELSAELESI
jgi:hypothetical protein